MRFDRDHYTFHVPCRGGFYVTSTTVSDFFGFMNCVLSPESLFGSEDVSVFYSPVLEYLVKKVMGD